MPKLESESISSMHILTTLFYVLLVCNALQIPLICLFLLHINVLLVLFENLQVQATFGV